MKTAILILYSIVLASCAPQQLDQGLELGLRVIEAKGKLSAADAKLVREGKTILLPAASGK